ncbi:MAG: enoyl-CoA hydratase/isomerase family protein [Candidatus Hodarchaeota archaeon]
MSVKFTMEGSFLSKVKNVGKITMLRDALDDKMITEINTALDKAEGDENVRCLVLASDTDSFCTSGEATEAGKALLDRIRKFKVPIIGMIHGNATGAGFDLALATDFRFAAKDAEFGWLGGGIKNKDVLKEILGPRKMEGIDLDTGKIGADKAGELGIANRILAKDELKSTVMFTATTISDNAPIAVRTSKTCYNLAYKASIEEGNKAELEACMECARSEDIQEGINALFQKRKAQFKGK